jgi:Spy/CpxP family protein refolding chaperone
MGHFMMGRMVSQFSEEIKATPDQKKALTALAEKAGEAVKAQHQGQQQLAEKALALWQGERWDAAQGQSLQKAQQELAKTGADTAIRYGLEVHKLLTPAQRKAAAEFIGQRGMRGHGPHGPGGFGGAPEGGE